MNIKCLPLFNWMTSPIGSKDLLGREPYLEIEPILCRNGIFKCGEKCWFEFNGKAYNYPVKNFIYDFKIIEVNEYDKREIKALQEVVLLGLATKEQKEIVHLHRYHGKKLNVEDLRRRKRFLAYKAIVEQKRLAKSV